MTTATCTNKSCISKPRLRTSPTYREVSEDQSYFESRDGCRNLDLGIIIGAVGFDPAVMIGAIAVAIGGTVIFGANTSTLKQTRTDMKGAEAHRAELISKMDLRVVGDGGPRIERDEDAPPQESETGRARRTGQLPRR